MQNVVAAKDRVSLTRSLNRGPANAPDPRAFSAYEEHTKHRARREQHLRALLDTCGREIRSPSNHRSKAIFSVDSVWLNCGITAIYVPFWFTMVSHCKETTCKYS